MIGDCGNAEMRDRLPDLLHERLPATLRAEVHRHLNQCADCREELALLQRVRAASIPVQVDTGRIAGAIPAYRAPSILTRAFRSPVLRIAAAIVLVAGGSMLVQTDAPQTAQIPPATADTPVVATVTPVVTGATAQASARPRQTPPAELAIGETFDDLSDSDLQALLKAMESLEAKTSTEPEVVIPGVNRGGA